MLKKNENYNEDEVKRTNYLYELDKLSKQAMVAYIQAGTHGMPPPKKIAELSIETADALLKALENDK